MDKVKSLQKSRWVDKSESIWAAFAASCGLEKVKSATDLPDRILDFIVDRYNGKWDTKRVHPRNLTTWLAQITEELEEQYPGRLSLKQTRQLRLTLARWERWLLLNFNFEVKKPHFLPASKLRFLMRHLWRNDTSRRFKRLYKASAIGTTRLTNHNKN